MKNPKKTVLFVEDDPLILTIYRNRLQREGFQVETVADGLAALEKLPQLKPSLVILDLMLPMLDGLDVLKFIRDDSDLKATPVLILSNAYMDDQASKALKAGANKGMLKSQCTPAKLMEVIHELLGMAEPPAVHGLKRAEVESAMVKADESSLKKTRDELVKEAPTEIGKIREHCMAYVKGGGSAECSHHLNELYQCVRFLCARASLSEFTRIAHLSTALEAMLFEIIFKSTTPSASALQTIAQAVDSLGHLFDRGDFDSSETTLKAKVLVVDDDPICNFATVAALKRAKLEAVSTQDPVASLKMAQADSFDIVLLDINMPELNGFEVCEQLRALPDYKDTPVIFVTSNSDFQSKAQSVLSGGNDLITKPISPLELTLKTVMHLIQPNGRVVHNAGATRAQTVPEPAKPAERTPTRNGEAKADLARNGEVKADPAPVNGKTAPVNGKAAPLNGKAVATNGATARFSPPPPRNAPPAPPRLTPPTVKFSAPKLSSAQTFQNHRIHLPTNGATHDVLMKNPSNQSFDRLAVEVARIIFGDDTLSDMNMRLTRIALERYNIEQALSAARPAESMNEISTGVARIIFGDENLSEMHLRLTRIALERYNVPEIVSQSPETAPEAAPRNGSHNGAHSEAVANNNVVDLPPAPDFSLRMKSEHA
ncbi:MAG TPA: response regulator [Verrucomicrobiae bacterium]|nr:response regulator [Verrucomicrobiae bacterium]